MQSRKFGCQQCGALLLFMPGTDQLVCQYCGHANRIPASADEIGERDYIEQLHSQTAAAATLSSMVRKCSNCAAEYETPGEIIAHECPFCGTEVVETTYAKSRIAPQSVLPFGVKLEQASRLFRSWLNGLWFAPSKLKRRARIAEKLVGVYVPYWTFDTQATTHYTGQRGEHYFVTVGSGKNRRQELRTRWYSASGVVWNGFDDLLVLASNTLPRPMTRALEPWDLEELVQYDEAYLSGFSAEMYQLSLPEAFEVAKERMQDRITAAINADIGGDVQVINTSSTQYDRTTFKHILLPIWISSYRFRNRSYRFLINARTGEVQGQRPWSWIKIGSCLFILAGVVAGIVRLIASN